MSSDDYIGYWKIIKCLPLFDADDVTSLENVEFELDRRGNVTWHPPQGIDPIPLFSCECFQVCTTSSESDSYAKTYPTSKAVLHFAGYEGHIIEFKIDHSVPSDVMLLTYDKWCMLQCVRVPPQPSSTSNSDPPFSLLSSLHEGYFSDITIQSSSGKQFHLHRVVLELGGVTDTNSLCGLPDDQLSAISHWLYAECLPVDLSLETAKCLANLGSPHPFPRLGRLCELYLQNQALRQQLVDLVCEVHACLGKMSGYFTSRHPEESPAQLCYVVKQVVRDCAVACAKMMVLCMVYSAHQLGQEEKQQVMQFARMRLPIIMKQIHRLFHSLKSSLQCITPDQRIDLANYLLPEIETILDTFSTLTMELKSAVDHILSSSDINKTSGSGEKLGQALKKHLHDQEMACLRDFWNRLQCFSVYLRQIKESCRDMSAAHKVRSIALNVELLIEELPIAVLRLDEIMTAMDERLHFNQFKFIFTLAASNVASVLRKLVMEKVALQSLMTFVCELVQREAFSNSLVALGLLEGNHISVSTPTENSYSCDPAAMFNLVAPQCRPPCPKDSYLAAQSLKLLDTSHLADMEFQVLSPPDGPDENGEAVCHRFRAHRVIVASRCDWFKRALLSGMREAIDKKIMVHDISGSIFSLFLEWVYFGGLSEECLAADQLADLLMLADRYGTLPLKRSCELQLQFHLNHDSALFILSIADQYHAQDLKEHTLKWLTAHPEVVDSELIEELTPELQTEVEDSVVFLRPRRQSGNVENHDGRSSPGLSLADLEERTALLHIQSSEDSADAWFVNEREEEAGELAQCVTQLRDILGSDVPHPQLVRIAIDADFDVNRAVNYFFSS